MALRTRPWGRAPAATGRPNVHPERPTDAGAAVVGVVEVAGIRLVGFTPALSIYDYEEIWC
jgi:hypothetical protein